MNSRISCHMMIHGARCLSVGRPVGCLFLALSDLLCLLSVFDRIIMIVQILLLFLRMASPISHLLKHACTYKERRPCVLTVINGFFCRNAAEAVGGLF